MRGLYQLLTSVPRGILTGEDRYRAYVRHILCNTFEIIHKVKTIFFKNGTHLFWFKGPPILFYIVIF